MPDLGGRGSVDVHSGTEGLNHVLVSGEMGHDAELYLAVVSGEEKTSRFGNEAFTDFLTVILAYRNILKVGVA